MITFYLISLVTLFIFLAVVIIFSIRLNKELKEDKKRFNKELSSYYTKQAIKEAKDRQKLEKKF